MEELTAQILSLALESGFDDAGICESRHYGEMDGLDRWVAQGCHGTMGYMARGVEVRKDPLRFLPAARRALMVVKSYLRPEDCTTEPCAPHLVCVSRHALGRDYHVVMRRGLRKLARALREAGFQARWFVDTAPVMEKVLAARAGLGVIGRHSLLVHPRLGSWVVLGGVLTNAPLIPHVGIGAEAGLCATCDACRQTCPTGAIGREGYLLSHKCIAYRTIEHIQGEEPTGCEGLAGWLYGCDLCQEVCPLNRGVEFGRWQDFGPRWCAPRYDSSRLVRLDEDGFTREFGHSSVRRLGLARLLSNLES